jgi:hypothetical protein
MDNTTQLLTFLIILAVFVANSVVRRRDNIPQRPIIVFDLLSRLVSDSVESNRPLHLSFGSAGVGERETVLALASADFLYASATQVAIGDAPPIISVGNSSTLQIARDMARRAHKNSPVADEKRPYDIRWYPNGTQFGLVATAGVLNRDDRASSHIMAGSYGAELALLLWGNHRQRIPSIAASDRLDGQAVAVGMADGYLLGEEIFAAAGYMVGNESLAHRNVILDLTRWLLIATIFILLVVNLAGRI